MGLSNFVIQGILTSIQERVVGYNHMRPYFFVVG